MLDKYKDYKIVDINKIDNSYVLIETVEGPFSDILYYIKKNSNEKILYKFKK